MWSFLHDKYCYIYTCCSDYTIYLFQLSICSTSVVILATYDLIVHFASPRFALAFGTVTVVRSGNFVCCFFQFSIIKVECESSSGDLEFLWKYLWQSTQRMTGLKKTEKPREQMSSF